MRNLGRNDPCWCASGKKYKKCHLDREFQEARNPWDAVAANKKAFHVKRCFAEDADLGPCEGNIVKAHTVSRGPNLSKIAKRGKVVRYTVNRSGLRKAGGKLIATEIGIGDASVFHGFCSGHDRRLFSCIENEAFIGRPDQCLAIAYRTLSREFYGKNATSHLRETLRDFDKGKSPTEQIRLQHVLQLINHGNELAKKDLAHTHGKLTRALVEGRGNVLQSMIIEFESVLPFMLAGAWSPLTDLFGNELQDGLTNKPLEQIFISSFAANSRSYICVSWLNIGVAPGEIIAQQLRRLPIAQQASAILQFSIKHIENIFYDPEWFNLLSVDHRTQIDMLAATGVDTIGSVPNAAINLGLSFGLPDVAVTS